MSAPDNTPLPLEGVRILELGMVFVLPLAITPLAALGADVIKVEAAARPDQIRSGPPPDNIPREPTYNYGANFQSLNRNKRAITLDLRHPRGREILLKLVAKSDVVAENFTPRVLRNFDLEYETLRKVNERLIMLSSTGYGQTGPWQHYRAYGPNTESVDGLMHLTGYPDGPPVRAGAGGLGVAFTDAAGAFFGTYAILGALEHRDRTGEGLWLDLSHYECGVATIPAAILDYTMNQRVRQRNGNRHAERAPQGCYPCRGDDRWIFISCAGDEEFRAMARALDLEGMASDPRFATRKDRQAQHDALDAQISARTRDLDAQEVEAMLRTAGVEAAVVAKPADVWRDEQLRHRGFFEVTPPPPSMPDIGPRPHLRTMPWKMSVTPPTTRRLAPGFGEHTDEVLGELLGYDAATLAELRADGVVADEPAPNTVARPGTVDLETLLATGAISEVDPSYRSLAAELTETQT